MKKKELTSKGFTLIELIVVMAVILVLSSFLVPRFNGYREKAIKMKAIDTGRQIYTAAFMSYMENNNNYSEEAIKNTTKDLVGIQIITAKPNDEGVKIEYNIDGKGYTLEIDNDNKYTIVDKLKQIYPTSK
ncbi:type II secretion system protein [Clostridium ganghwense]|uniref:Type II secretion system protein n=1 Tax=Clostridium ganghwense TaxID=312089 RepID=A0ABT4CQR2_9CLOT|nr:type II secretion system protein [Clostridium ganghwense]